MDLSTASDIEQFHEFVSQQLAKGSRPSPEAALDSFRHYQRELEALRAKIDVGLEESRRGLSAPFDLDETMKSVRERIESTEPGR